MEFQNLVAKTVYATKRAIPDTCRGIEFLIISVQAPNKEDFSKLVHLIQYLRVTNNIQLTLSGNRSIIIKWWVDASFAVHPNMRGHSVGGLSLGRGVPIVGSIKHKINTKSSTEIEIVVVEDFMPAIFWS